MSTPTATANVIDFPAAAPTTSTRRKRRLWIRLSDQERADLVTVAAENGKTLTEMIREAVTTYVADYREEKIAFQRRGCRTRVRLTA